MKAALTQTTGLLKPANPAGSTLLRRLLRVNPEFGLHRVGAPQRADVETYIAKVFDQTYGATVSGFAPFLISMSCAGQISAAAGIRPAGFGPLFLEQYLDAPVENVLSSHYGLPVERQEIFELGNLAALRPGVCQLIYLIMAGMVSRTSLNYAVFAGNRQVARGVSKLGFEIATLAPANPARLGEGAADWGSYYDSDPQIMTIDLRNSMQLIKKLPLPSIMLNLYDGQITELAAQFNRVHRLSR
jgi:hypothetical protein